MIDQPEQVLAALLPFLERIAERPRRTKLLGERPEDDPAEPT
ncbi:MAG: hypothetical protein ACR2MB_04275 [Acidimicrobiales bacterium]